MSGHKARRAIAWGVAVLGIGVIVVGSLGPNAVVNPFAVDEARAAKARDDVRAICDASIEFRAEKGRWPRDVVELVCTDEPLCCNPGLDPWREYYVMVTRADRVTVTCYGADGEPGGDGVDADIVFSRSLPLSD